MSFYTNRPISGKYEISFMPKTQTYFQFIRKVWGFEENRQTEDRCQIATVKVDFGPMTHSSVLFVCTVYFALMVLTYNMGLCF